MSTERDTLDAAFKKKTSETDALTDDEILALCPAPSGNPANATAASTTSGPPKTIRASVIRWMCSDSEAQKFIDPGGIRLTNYQIGGVPSKTHPGVALDLCSLKIPFPLIFHRCSLPAWLLLLGTEIPFLDLDGCDVGSIAGDVLKVRGDLYMRNGFHSGGVIKFPGAALMVPR